MPNFLLRYFWDMPGKQKRPIIGTIKNLFSSKVHLEVINLVTKEKKVDLIFFLIFEWTMFLPLYWISSCEEFSIVCVCWLGCVYPPSSLSHQDVNTTIKLYTLPAFASIWEGNFKHFFGWTNNSLINAHLFYGFSEHQHHISKSHFLCKCWDLMSIYLWDKDLMPGFIRKINTQNILKHSKSLGKIKIIFLIEWLCLCSVTFYLNI